MQAKGLVDLLIPRGGAGLIRACVENATVPCIETGTGICHVYVDEYADLDKAVSIIVNAKTSRPSVCNAEEVCLVHRAVAAQFLPMLKKALVDDRAAQGLTPSSCGWTRQRRRSSTAPPLPTRTLTRSIWTISSPSAWSTAWTPPSRTCCALHAPQRAIVTEDAASAERFINGRTARRLRQRLHPLHRRRRVRPRLRDGHLHAEAPRPRPHGARRAEHL